MKRSRRFWYGAALSVLAVVIMLTAAACGGSSSSSSSSAPSGNSFVGAGSTFAQPLYTAWAQTYQGVSSGVKLNYQGVGSTAGIAANTSAFFERIAAASKPVGGSIATIESNVNR